MTLERFLQSTNMGQSVSKIKAYRKSNGEEVEIELRVNNGGITGGMRFYYWNGEPVSVTKNEDGTYTVDDSKIAAQETALAEQKRIQRNETIFYVVVGVLILAAVVIFVIKKRKILK